MHTMIFFYFTLPFITSMGLFGHSQNDWFQLLLGIT